MRISVVVAALLAFVLSACGSNVQDVKSAQKGKIVQEVTKMDPSNPQVSVVDGKIVIDQETIRFAKDKQNVKITWHLPKDSKYTFSKDGIAIKDAGDEFPDCQVEPNEKGLKFSCKNKHSKPGKYKYTINVEGSPTVPPLDPIVENG